MRVSVIGGGTCTDHEGELAHEVGDLLGDRGHTLVCGGMGGVMAAACAGAKAAGGHTIGILPTERRSDANPHVDTAIATGMGHARNALVIVNGDAVIAIDGGGGTLSEVGYAHVFDRPIAGLGTHCVQGLDHVEHVESPRDAVEYVEAKA